MSVASDKQQILVHNEQDMVTSQTRINSVRESKVEEKSYLMLDLGVLAEDTAPSYAKIIKK